MTPSEAIKSLDSIRTGIRSYADRINFACDSAETTWTTMKRLTGAREDDAACILAPLGAIMADLATFAANCASQVTEMNRDPFAEDHDPPKPTGPNLA